MTDLLRLPILLNMVRDTISDPRRGAEMVLALNLPRSALWLAFALTIVFSMILAVLVTFVLGTPEEGPLTGRTPVALGLLQGAFLFLAVHAVTHIGRIFGGTGSFEGALALITWLQFIFIVLQVLQLMVALIAPPLAAVISLLAIVLFFWLLSHFVTVLHGFTSVGQVFLMTLLSFMVILFTLSLVLSLLGLGLPTGTPT
ncbi:Yip1 family protein [Gymnodinialimonas hymeniacidonis]|uniref:Yip1 family protein n=1 Tax=Gymnodinialimonas hymeniacidonis TaxID=3126508 RepID=UPI0034C697E3